MVSSEDRIMSIWLSIQKKIVTKYEPLVLATYETLPTVLHLILI